MTTRFEMIVGYAILVSLVGLAAWAAGLHAVGGAVILLGAGVFLLAMFASLFAQVTSSLLARLPRRRRGSA